MQDTGDLLKPSSAETSFGNNTFEAKKPIKIPEIRVDQMVLYHGSGISGIKEFRAAEETTLGYGLYLTSSPDAGRGYAIRRAKRMSEGKPIVYEVEIKDLRLANFNDQQTLEMFSQLLRERLERELQKPNLSWQVQATLQKTLDLIRARSYKRLRDLSWNHQDLTTEIIRNQGFDGLIDVEGGEGEEIQEHDTYLIFDPSKGKILREI